jgi:hypothetical protein
MIRRMQRESQMLEAKVIEIYKAQTLRGYSSEELREADQWVKQYALDRLSQHLKAAGVTKAFSEYVMLMARCHYGSIETDHFLSVHLCYPKWMVED